ncbi:hypothetical protein Cni_G06364 [Canna indica]|uniref:Reverse transcriptase zinc-binding domain-containing protein n=1 Tax=Canna indica TaxID=4628 RepID=A0AAQ3JX47_9LILI|nr:hypothetical protein Cni_G06364 [Canna indica]
MKNPRVSSPLPPPRSPDPPDRPLRSSHPYPGCRPSLFLFRSNPSMAATSGKMLNIADIWETISNIEISVQPNDDFVAWTTNENGMAIISFAYLFLKSKYHPSINNNPLWNLTWKLFIVAKVKLLLRKFFHGRLLTKIRLLKLGLSVNSSCVFCNNDDESIIHLFLDCNYVSDI